jgi:hypothetical protein
VHLRSKHGEAVLTIDSSIFININQGVFMSFTAMIGATDAAWGVAQTELTKIRALNAETTPQDFAKAMLNAQLTISVATSVEQKASAAIDKAYQAHSQVASK